MAFIPLYMKDYKGDYMLIISFKQCDELYQLLQLLSCYLDKSRAEYPIFFACNDISEEPCFPMHMTWFELREERTCIKEVGRL